MNSILNQENFLNHIEEINEKIILYEKNDFLFAFLNDFLHIYIFFILGFIIINLLFLRLLKGKLIDYINQEHKDNLFYNYLLFINKTGVIVFLISVITASFVTSEGYKEIVLSVKKEKIIDVNLNEQIVYDVLVEYDINEIKKTDNLYIVYYEEDGVFKKIYVSSNDLLITIGEQNKVSLFDSMNVVDLMKNKKLDNQLTNKLEILISLEDLYWLGNSKELKTFKSIKKIQLTEEVYLSLLKNKQEKVGDMNE